MLMPPLLVSSESLLRLTIINVRHFILAIEDSNCIVLIYFLDDFDPEPEEDLDLGLQSSQAFRLSIRDTLSSPSFASTESLPVATSNIVPDGSKVPAVIDDESLAYCRMRFFAAASQTLNTASPPRLANVPCLYRVRTNSLSAYHS